MPYADPAKNAESKRNYDSALKAADKALYNAKRLEITKRYQAKYPERVRENNKRYKQRNPHMIMLWQAKDRARRFGLEFSLTRNDIIIPTHCPVLGLELKPGSKNWCDSSPSLDRINPAKGYTRDNVCVISWRANNLKRDGTVGEFEKLLAYMKARS